MRHHRWFRVFLAAAVASSALGAATAQAGETTIVIQPYRATKTDKGAAKDGVGAWLTQQLPASEAFNVDLPLVSLPAAFPEDAVGFLEVWPEVESMDIGGSITAAEPCARGPKNDALQYQKLAMTPAGDATARVLRTKVSPLQIGQPFCFRLKVQAHFGKKALETIASGVAGRLRGKIKGCSAEDAGGNISRIEENLTQLLKDQGYDVLDTGNAARRIWGRFEADCVQLARDVTSADSLFLQNTNAVDAGQKTLADALQRVKALDEPQIEQPVFFNSKSELEKVTDLLGAKKDDPDLKKAAAQIKGPPAWVNVLDLLLQGKQKEAKEAAKAALKTHVPVLLWNETAWVSFSKYRTAPSSPPSLKEAASQLGKLAELFKRPPGAAGANAFVPDLDPARKAFTALQKADEDLRAAEEEQNKARIAVGKAEDAFNAKLKAALVDDDVARELVVEVSKVLMDGVAGRGTTPNAGSFASADIGVAVALPSGGAGPQVWALPYVALNLYSTAVDRTIPLGEIVGGGAMGFRQRVSLTGGLTLTQPGLPTVAGRTTNAIFLGTYPLVALGMRWTPYVRSTVGLVFYELTDKNPASAAAHFEAAPFLGVSIDADVVQLVTSVQKGIGGK